MKNVILTGATGFIGSWLALELLNHDIEVTVIVRRKDRLLNDILRNPKCHVIEKSLEDIAPEDFPEADYDVFYHLAWAGVSPEHKNDVSTQLGNISNAIRALEVCNKIHCKLMIAAGTVAEYVFCDNVMDVYARQSPNDMYGAAKVSAHYFLEVRARQLNQPFIWSVIPSTFGERRTDNNIITYTIRSLLRGEKPKYGNLTQMWDFLYVAEVARAFRYIGEKGIPGKVYGIGSGEYFPLRHYIEKIRDYIDPELPLGIGEVPSMSNQTFSSCVNTYELVKDTGYVSKISFEEGIKKTINWFREIGGGTVSKD